MREKSELEKWLDKYYEAFDENYPLCIVSMKSEAEIIAEIKKCISEGKPAKEPKYDSDNVY